jgi:hypothetical protein
MRPLNLFFVFCILTLSCGLAAGQCAPCTVWAPNSTPTLVDSGEAASVELGMKFRADSDGFVTGIRFYKSAVNGGTHTGNLWSSSGSLLATAQFTGESASGWQQVSFSAPVPITAGTTYIASYFAPLGHYAFDMNFFATSGVDNAPLHALANGVDGANGVYSYGFVSSFPASSYASTNYWVDVVYVPKGATLPAPTVTTTAPANAAGGIPIISTLSATFSSPMDPSSINATTFQLFGPGNSPISGVVSYSATTTTATLQPSSNLSYQTTYTAVIRAAARDFLGDLMGSDFNWTFTTESTASSSLCPCTIWPSTTVPGVQDSGESTALELGVKFSADLDGYLTGIRFYKSAGNTGTHIGNIWSTAGVLLGSATFTGESASGWQQATFSSPVLVSAGTTYVASYFTSAGHYSFDQNYFLVDLNNVPLHAPSNTNSGGNGVYVYTASSAFPSLSYNSSNYWVDVVYVPRNSSAPPVITGTTPGNGTTGAPLGGAVTVRFSEPMDPSTITSAAFQLADASNNVVPGTVSYVPSTASLVFQPGLSLTPETVYTATVRSTVRDTFGNALAADYSWSFTAALPPGETGPGGPILVIASAVNPFSRYFGEILLAEGMNEFRVKDITTVTPDVLAQYDIAILGDFTLTGAQASMLTTWVNNGGGLIAMHPDPQLASLLGLTSTGANLSDGYLLINTQTAPGKGIVGQTIQFHGSADLYTLSGATSIATLYSGVSTPTSSPAVTLANAGVGQAAAFTYDLAKSVVMLRQGNPAWSGQDRDGYVDPAQLTTEIRANDLFYGNASFDPEPDWVNLSKVQIPQADEQQRLLANLIQLMNASRKPLPRFWYLPSGFKAAIVMTGDEHGGNGTGPRFDNYISESPANCSVADWTCVRATSYMFPANVNLPNYQTHLSQGFEIANHADNSPSCTAFTAASLDAAISAQLALMTQFFPAAPPSTTNRTHCVLWSDYDTEPVVLLNHGIRFDTTYYYWPDMWVQGRPGLFTGSGMPMRYADRNGNVIDVYQATTQFPDETTWNFPADIDTVLDNAVGSNGYYAVITANMHMDHAYSPGSDSIVTEAQARGVPVVTSVQMLTLLDGRNNSTFSNISWSTNTLSFSVTAASGARNLQVLVPAHANAGTLASLTLNGTAVAYTVQTIKGISYASFLTTGGNYQAVYRSSSISGTITGSGANGASVRLSGAATLTTTADPSGNFSFSGLDNGSYTITPSNPGYSFTPTSRAVTVNGANVTGVNFTGTAIPIASLSPSSLAFGSQALSTTSSPQIVTLSNTGAGALTISSIALSGSNPGDFAATNNCGSSLAAGANCSITVTFKPTAASARSATLSVTDNASGSPQRVTLTGTGISPVASLSPTAIPFGIRTINTSGAAVVATLRNIGNATMTISSVVITGTNAVDFARTTTCGASLTAGASCTISVTFGPATTGVKAATVSVTDNAPGSPHTIALTGTGTAVTVAPASLIFGSQPVGTSSQAQVVTVTNVGTTTLTSLVISMTGANTTDFGETTTCSATLAARSSCTISVTFTPTSSGGRAAGVRIASADPASPVQVTLTGTATSPAVTLTPTSLAFGVQTLHTTSTSRAITVRNSGTATLTINSITITGTNAADFASTTTCAATLAANATCTISVTFSPTAIGARAASVSVSDNAPGNPHTVPLTGTGAAVTATPTRLTFASRTVGTTSPAQTVTVSNVGTTSVTGISVSDTGTNAGDFNETTTCGTVLSAGTNCTISVTFVPSARGTRTATLRVTDSDPSSPQQVTLTGTGQ